MLRYRSDGLASPCDLRPQVADLSAVERKTACRGRASQIESKRRARLCGFDLSARGPIFRFPRARLPAIASLICTRSGLLPPRGSPRFRQSSRAPKSSIVLQSIPSTQARGPCSESRTQSLPKRPIGRAGEAWKAGPLQRTDPRSALLFSDLFAGAMPSIFSRLSKLGSGGISAGLFPLRSQLFY